MNDLQKSFVFNRGKCLQCGGCETACKLWRAPERGIAFRRVLNLWQGSYPDVACSSLSLACLHCAEPACAAVCPAGAIAKRTSDGLVLVDQSLCTGCRACFDACPYGIPQYGADGLMQKCDMCASEPTAAAPPCVCSCPTGALDIALLTVSQKRESEKETSDLLHRMDRL
jgi:anaerobic dimethyl sulfoxide reductase subunit B (iron-sulfur subunit)